MPRAVRIPVLAAVSILALVGVRVLALGADPPGWLSWSGGIATDEGFYTLDARHLVLFGTWARGNFHDRLLSPGLSAIQQGVFHVFGTSLVTARAMDAVLGLMTIALLWLGLRASFGTPAASAGALLVGFAPPFVLYNRLALQETPTVFWLTASFALWAMGVQTPRRRLLALAGAAAGMAFLCKALAIVFFPALCWGFLRSGRGGWMAAGGLALVLICYGVFWYVPHHAELARMGDYYRRHQFLPHSIRSLWLNIRRAGVGNRAGVLRGAAPYLLLFVPVPCVLAISRLRGFASKSLGEQVLWMWLAGGVLFCCVSSYAPDRYYVLFLPAACGLAGVAFAALGPVRQRVFGLTACVVNVFWLGTAWHGRTWTARDNARVLSRLLPARSVVIGDMAPAACLGTTLDAVPVQAGLSNDRRPVETLGADYLAVTRAPVYTQWWRTRYPQVVQPRRRMVSLAVGTRWIVDVYKVRP